MSMAEFDFFIEHRKGEGHIIPDVLSRHPTKENIPDDVVISPKSAVIVFIIITTSVDIPNHNPELVHGTFNNTMACLYNANHHWENVIQWKTNSATNNLKYQGHCHLADDKLFLKQYNCIPSGDEQGVTLTKALQKMDLLNLPG